MEKLVMERIKENKELFTDKELDLINNNYKLIKKVYLLGLLDGKEIYGKNLQ